MPALKDMEIGLMFWGERNPLRTVRAVKALGLSCGQLGFTGQLVLDSELVSLWKEALAREQFTVTTVFAAYSGESYADIPTVQQTVGFIPAQFRKAREARTYEVLDATAALGIKSFANHIGFVPEDRSDPDYASVRDIVRRICEYAHRQGILYALETGQEPAPVMKAFIEDVGMPNLRVNFDPANLILYGTSDPIEALDLLAPYVASVHVKDGTWPSSDTPEAFGSETPLGDGDVGMERFIAKLKEIGYRGPLTIEREVSLEQDMNDRHKEGLSHLDDIRNAIALLERLRDL